jgi:hypothetical protein
MKDLDSLVNVEFKMLKNFTIGHFSDNNALKDLSLPELHTVTSDVLKVDNNANLTNFRAAKLQFVGNGTDDTQGTDDDFDGLVFTDNAKIQTLDLPGLLLLNRLHVANNNLLTTINMPALLVADIMKIENNPIIKNIEFGSEAGMTNSAEVKRLSILSNPQLERFRLATSELDNLDIQDNHNLTIIEFPDTDVLGPAKLGPSVPGDITVYKNDLLRLVDFRATTHINININISYNVALQEVNFVSLLNHFSSNAHISNNKMSTPETCVRVHEGSEHIWFNLPICAGAIPIIIPDDQPPIPLLNGGEIFSVLMFVALIIGSILFGVYWFRFRVASAAVQSADYQTL